MKQDIKKKWLKALRSGSYKQGKSYLRSKDNRFCCLGVLCDVLDPKGWYGYFNFCHKYSEDDMNLSSKCLDKIGMKESTMKKLIGMNDGGDSFKQIASYISKNL